ncbi:hypothetical protein QFZ49_003206 [Streptomyces turgidiscabies]|uniref:Uncharacterized protein n=1 Tax=Streptomyces turgidiscabies TaxID=85558 RepID=A0ABU0RMP5_9ACTN|nr:hypothetical protein [Streptomyces turgidiscabies]
MPQFARYRWASKWRSINCQGSAWADEQCAKQGDLGLRGRGRVRIGQATAVRHLGQRGRCRPFHRLGPLGHGVGCRHSEAFPEPPVLLRELGDLLECDVEPDPRLGGVVPPGPGIHGPKILTGPQPIRTFPFSCPSLFWSAWAPQGSTDEGSTRKAIGHAGPATRKARRSAGPSTSKADSVRGGAKARWRHGSPGRRRGQALGGQAPGAAQVGLGRDERGTARGADRAVQPGEPLGGQQPVQVQRVAPLSALYVQGQAQHRGSQLVQPVGG